MSSGGVPHPLTGIDGKVDNMEPEHGCLLDKEAGNGHMLNLIPLSTRARKYHWVVVRMALSQ
jgi:hypothetical protein